MKSPSSAGSREMHRMNTPKEFEIKAAQLHNGTQCHFLKVAHDVTNAHGEWSVESQWLKHQISRRRALLHIAAEASLMLRFKELIESVFEGIF